jgi:hypothetical protein
VDQSALAAMRAWPEQITDRLDRAALAALDEGTTIRCIWWAFSHDLDRWRTLRLEGCPKGQYRLRRTCS